MSAKYVQFPLFLLRNLFTNRTETINKMLSFGIYNYSKQMICSETETNQYLLSELQLNRLGPKLKKLLASYVIDVNSVNSEMLTFVLRAQPLFLEKATEYVSVRKALEALQLTGSPEQSLECGKSIGKMLDGKDPMPMVKTLLLFAFRDGDKSEFEIAQLLAYIAIKSILGQKQYVKTNKRLVLARMFGYSKCLPKEGRLTYLQQKYAKRYHMDRVLEQLQLNWKVKIYSNHIRGFYVTTGSKMSLTDMVFKAESTKRKAKLAMLKKQKHAALTAATQQLLNGITATQAQHLK